MKNHSYFIGRLSVIAAVFLAVLSCSVEKNGLEEELVYNDGHTLIIYMMGNNGLSTFMDNNLTKILKTAPEALDHGKIAIFYDRGNYTRLTELYKTEEGVVKQRILMQWAPAEVSSVDPEFMSSVFSMVKEQLPSESYGVVFSSHGGGWVPSDIFDLYLEQDRTVFSTGVSTKFFGQDGLSCMEIPDLAAVLSDLSPDYIVFDACLMSSVEALYDLRNVTDYIVASPVEVDGAGFPYEDFLPMLFLEHSGPLKVCEAFASRYASSFGAVSLIDCGMLTNLALKMKKVLASASSSPADISGIQAFDGFNTHLYFDLMDYVRSLGADSSLVEDFASVLSQVLLYEWHTDVLMTEYGNEGPYDVKSCCGITCHVPQQSAPQTHKAWLGTAWATAIGAAE